MPYWGLQSSCVSSTRPTSPAPPVLPPVLPMEAMAPLTPSLTPPHQVITWQAQEGAIPELTPMMMVTDHPTLAPPPQHVRVCSAHALHVAGLISSGHSSLCDRCGIGLP